MRLLCGALTFLLKYLLTIPEIIKFYLFFRIFPQVVTGNNDYVAFPTGYPKFETIGGLVKKFTFRIPRFNDTVLIDPSVNVGSYIPAVTNPTNKPGGGGHNAGQSLHFVSYLLLLSMFASLCCFY